MIELISNFRHLCIEISIVDNALLNTGAFNSHHRQSLSLRPVTGELFGRAWVRSTTTELSNMDGFQLWLVLHWPTRLKVKSLLLEPSLY